ncbi:hypothetical protein AUJ95_03125 [Candidatus Desantisbacteria bacterium CG2_30_40_21]|uniref:t-SNARE coiled-coil homology domain-containing protein n=3 Tax=unclassified Candidatus Desantisiibacteriota TaxID=3106372 RepID=A0A2M7JEY7_9BACT|nr:MAG: hypothetical protein AUJ95_03125 [Candidatus Desantisbacteria bacterium CG2_30_40_21]PIX17974.1 MAG: hypothetical protein COZ71_00440 [Candidatus Desantisbacteria bacterium CG_4_8_14_3_um_filter_40_12]PJB29635.1 MAG: hypothetical protein CO110_04685 [Candidatus Desantisbacteria bacterium CG_4_9_14_3_um_filter_40_11]
MKKVLFLWLVYVLLLPCICSAELTKQDIYEIQKIVKDEISGVNLRIDDMNKRIDDMNKRIDDMNQQMNKRIDDITNLLYVILSGMFALVGFVLWDRRTALAPAIKKVKEIEEVDEKVKKALREYAIQEPRLAIILKGVGLM